MRNLKKVLTLVLTLAMLLSVMVVGAGAATFGDQESITNKEAVDVCTTLNIIGGYEDGTFRPAGNVTRAEMSKMICVALNGGQEPTMGSNLIATFNDVASTDWSAPYIEYCVSQGIVGGVGGGNFNPTGNITGTQAAKMLLCILGYNASIQGYVGSDYWETNINVDAAQKGLYAGLSNLDASAPLTRDQAAQMIWNALNAYEVEYKTTLVAGPDGTLTSKVIVQDKVVGNTNDKITLLEDKYEAKTFVGTFNGNTDTLGLKNGYIQVEGALNSAGDEPSAPAGGGPAPTSYLANFPFALDIKYIGEEVKVLYQDKANDGKTNLPDDKDTIYGVYVTGSTTVYNIIKDDLQTTSETKKIKFGDKTYDVGASTSVGINVNYGASTVASSASATDVDFTTALKGLAAQSGDTIKLIVNDSDKIVAAYVVESKLAKVNSVNADKVSISNSVGSIEIADNDVYSGIAKGDVVTVTTYYKTNATDDGAYTVVKKAETVSGKLDGFKEGAAPSTYEKVTVDGKVYSVEDKTLTANLTDDSTTSFTSNNVGDDVVLYLVNGFVGGVDLLSTSSNYAVVTDTTGATGGYAGSLTEFKMSVLLADGTKQTVTVDEDSAETDPLSTIAKGDIVKYSSISGSGVMNLTKICDENEATAAVSNIYNKDLKTFNGIMTDENAVLFVKVTTPSVKWYAYNIRTLNTFSVSSDSDTTSNYVTNSDGKVVAAYVSLTNKPTGSTADTVYGIVTADNGVVKVGDSFHKSYIVSNDNGDNTVYLPDDSVVLEKGKIVFFDKTSDSVYSDLDMKVTAVPVYVQELDKGNVLSYYEGVSRTADGTWVGYGLKHVALDSDAQIVYVDQDGDKAGTTGSVEKFDSITGYANAAVVINATTNKIDAIIVETSNKCDIMTAAKVTVTGTLDATQNTVTVTIPNTGLSGSDTDYSVALKDATNTDTVTGVTPAITTLNAGALTITLSEDAAGAALTSGTYTLTITKTADGSTTTYTIGI